ncbi:hypothetical protein IM792_02115 [Mucilaginibacter sp. JRF]|uniref:glycosyl hydrolase family 95 catalytic domain-containing protein n=1 Tax=Mucilaginibacter sp. JRF TaxID=2780088 RepID=UPI001881D6BA|nr:hypothetical protein [Mucilaginibacter sp. JRF]MBE9583233.1 hypothetical protein [Mucilaginibacter sp. JRF]
MRFTLFIIIALCLSYTAYAQPSKYKNVWTKAPSRIPNNASVDAPLMGNGDILMSMGQVGNTLRYYLSKNDFWRLQSKADHLSGPRIAGYLDINITDVAHPYFQAEQSLFNGTTTCTFGQNNEGIIATSWVAATDNLIFITLKTIGKPITISISVGAPANNAAKLKIGSTNGIAHLTRAFTDDVDIPTEIDVAVKALGQAGNTFTIAPGKPVTLALAFESKFKQNTPLAYVLKKAGSVDQKMVQQYRVAHQKWWQAYWQRSQLTVADTVLMKAYYQGLYTMAACSRDTRFPPSIFGWCVTDNPDWNGDYHLNYNFYAPFYALYSANRLQQAQTQDAPLLDFMPKGQSYAQKVTGTRGILYPVGIGPLGVDLTRDFPAGTDNGYTEHGDVEAGGLFYKQRSNAVFGVINMAQHWRCNYDKDYGRLIYPYVLATIDFWEDYLTFEQGRYVIYRDAITEKSGYNKNPLMTLALLRNALELILDMSKELNRDAPRRAKWQDMLNKLSDYPTEVSKGKTVYRGAEADSAGRPVHGASYSAIYPANGITFNSTSTELAIARNSVDATQRWDHHNSTNSFYMAAIRVGYDSLTILKELHIYALRTYPNGFQLDNPHGIENSCTVVNALQEMCCMSVGNRIRLFPVWPKDQDAAFRDIRTWGAFLVSAKLSNGIISGVVIKSERGKHCEVLNPWPSKTVSLVRNGKPAGNLKGSILSFKTTVNELITLQPLF